MKRKLLIAIIALPILLVGHISVKAQNKINLLDYSACEVIKYDYNFVPTQYNTAMGNIPIAYEWIFTPDIEYKDNIDMRHKEITPNNTIGNDPYFPISELPTGSNKSLRLGTMEYIKGKDTGKGGGVKYKYQVTEENAIMYINYAMWLVDSQKEHIDDLKKTDGQPFLDDVFWVGGYGYYEYNSDWVKQQPQVHFVIYIDNDTLCKGSYAGLYDPNGNPTILKQEWPHKQFQTKDKNSDQTYTFDGYYKDWTLMAVDLTPYIGHSIAFSAEYYDCGQAGWVYLMDANGNVYQDYPQPYLCDEYHQACLYIDVSCSSNGNGSTYPTALFLIEEDCYNNKVTYSAPDGFHSYKWYSSNNPGQILSTSQTCPYTFAPGETDLTLFCTVTSVLTLECNNNGTTFSIPIHNNCRAEGDFFPPDYVCADVATLDIPFAYTSGSPLSYDITFDDNAVASGFTNLTNQTIPTGATAISVPMPPSNNQQYSRPNLYSYTLRVHQSNGTDTVITKSLEVRYPSWLIQQRWNDVLALYNQNYNGGYVFSNIEWYQDGAPAWSAAPYNTYIYQPGGLNPESEYWAVLTRAQDGLQFCTCPYRPVIQPEYTTAPERIQLTADQTDSRIVRVNTEQSGIYTLYNIDGRKIGQGYFGADYGSPAIILPAAGIYLIRFENSEQGIETIKWIAE